MQTYGIYTHAVYHFGVSPTILYTYNVINRFINVGSLPLFRFPRNQYIATSTCPPKCVHVHVLPFRYMLVY